MSDILKISCIFFAIKKKNNRAFWRNCRGSIQESYKKHIWGKVKYVMITITDGI